MNEDRAVVGYRPTAPSAPVDFRAAAIEREADELISKRNTRSIAARFAAAVHATSDAIVNADASGAIVDWNPAAERLFGYAAAEILDRPLTTLMPIRFRRAHWETIQRELRGGAAHILGQTVEATGLHRNGREFPLELSLASWESDGERFFTGVLRDISQRKRSEQALRDSHEAYTNLLETTLDGFWRLDAAGRLREVNPRYCRQSGYTRDELIGMHVDELDANENPSEAEEHIRRIIEVGGDQFETTHRRKDGTIWHVEVSVSYRHAEAGQFFVFLRDIDERVRVQRQLEEQQATMEMLVQQRTRDLSEALEAAKIAEQTKDTFLANVSHELRTPLNAVIGMSRLAQRIGRDPLQLDYLDKACKAGKLLSRLIDDLLDLSKIAAGRLEFETTTFGLRQLIARSSALMDYKLREKGLFLVVKIDDEVPDTVRGDPLRIEQIVNNLLSNAIKFTAAGRIEIRIALVALAALEADRVHLSIEVEDSGAGLTAQEIAGLFRPFTQADASMSRKYGGTGLGLAICKYLAEMMDGSIGVSSREGEGATFRVTLRLAAGHACDLAPEDNEPNDATNCRYRDAHVLVVDDQPYNREIAQALLTYVGITPCLAAHGQEAIERLNDPAAAFDLVLMDVQMPIKDGLTATRELRMQSRFAALPIVAMTAHTMAHENLECIEAGMNDYIGKPFDDAAFHRMLTKWLPPSKRIDAADAAMTMAAASAPTAGFDRFPALSGIDTRAGLALLAGDRARYRHWLNDFVRHAPSFAAQIRTALAAGHTEHASRCAHAFKGRTGLLGMQALHALATTLETALERGEPSDEMPNRIQQSVVALCDEIRSALGDEAPVRLAPAPSENPGLEHPLPRSITHLVEMLNAGYSDCDAVAAHCLTELQDSVWAPRLQQALIHTQNFDYAAAAELFSSRQHAAELAAS